MERNEIPSRVDRSQEDSTEKPGGPFAESLHALLLECVCLHVQCPLTQGTGILLFQGTKGPSPGRQWGVVGEAQAK